MARKRTTKEFIKLARELHNDKYDYSKVLYENQRTKITIICIEHGEFPQRPDSHLRGRGCYHCGLKKIVQKKTMTTEDFVKKAKVIHDESYDYSQTVYLGTYIKINIICPKHGNYTQRPNDHLNGCGCSYCNGRATDINELIKTLNKIHQNKYDYSKVKFQKMSDKIEVICSKHGSFHPRTTEHKSGSGCPSCYREKITCSTEEFISKANKVHNKKYKYSKTVYITNKNNIIIDCIKHGTFLQRPDQHLTGQGCPKCAKLRVIQKNSSTTLEFIVKSKQVHNEKYDYSKVEYKNSKTKIKIICPKHGEFKQVPNYHLYGAGCPTCNSSKGELKIYNYLINNNIIFEPQKSFLACKHIKPLSFDFYLPDHKILIEYQGIQHYRPVKYFGGETVFKNQQKRDNIKRNFAKDNCIELIEISYMKYKTIEIILNEKLKIS